MMQSPLFNQPGQGWMVCPCGWRANWGVHYAVPHHVKFWRDILVGGGHEVVAAGAAPVADTLGVTPNLS